MKNKGDQIAVVVAMTLVLLLHVDETAYGGSLSSGMLVTDVLTQPDGQPFSGLMSIVPIGFESDETPPSITLPVEQSGMFEVHLPCTPKGAYYSVHFQADAKTSWDEKWIVPQRRDKLLRLPDIREGQQSNRQGDRAVTATTSLPISVSDVTGLSDRLSSLTSSLATATSSIASLTSLVNTFSSSSTTSQVRGEVPAGSINGNNTVFTLSSNPLSGTTVLYRNGVRLAVNVDYTISTSTVTFINGEIPQRGDVIVADYVKGTP